MIGSNWRFGLSPLGLLGTAATSLMLLACQPGGVGDPCIPEDEYDWNFSGYSENEVNVESRSFQCETRVCLVNHFSGRVSCPYGQTQAEATEWPVPDADWSNRCVVPGTDGRVEEGENLERIRVAVDPQFTGRRAEDAVYCSCRCANAQGSTNDGARYCSCPSGYSCQRLVEDLNLGSEQLAGSYCVKNGTVFGTEPLGSRCSNSDDESSATYCGERRPF